MKAILNGDITVCNRRDVEHLSRIVCLAVTEPQFRLEKNDGEDSEC